MLCVRKSGIAHYHIDYKWPVEKKILCIPDRGHPTPSLQTTSANSFLPSEHSCSPECPLGEIPLLEKYSCLLTCSSSFPPLPNTLPHPQHELCYLISEYQQQEWEQGKSGPEQTRGLTQGSYSLHPDSRINPPVL